MQCACTKQSTHPPHLMDLSASVLNNRHIHLPLTISWFYMPRGPLFKPCGLPLWWWAGMRETPGPKTLHSLRFNHMLVCPRGSQRFRFGNRAGKAGHRAYRAGGIDLSSLMFMSTEDSTASGSAASGSAVLVSNPCWASARPTQKMPRIGKASRGQGRFFWRKETGIEAFPADLLSCHNVMSCLSSGLISCQTLLPFILIYYFGLY